MVEFSYDEAEELLKKNLETATGNFNTFVKWNVIIINFLAFLTKQGCLRYFHVCWLIVVDKKIPNFKVN